MLIIWGFTNFWGREGYKKTIYIENCLKRGVGQFAGGLAKNREEIVFEGDWYLDVSALNFDQSFLQFNAKEKINTKKSSQFEFKCGILKTASLNI